MQVGFDTGYNLLNGINEAIRGELHLNLARYLRIRPQSLDPDAINVQLIQVVGESSIWIQATRDIFAGDILWRSPDTRHGSEIADVQVLFEIHPPDSLRASLRYPLVRLAAAILLYLLLERSLTTTR